MDQEGATIFFVYLVLAPQIGRHNIIVEESNLVGEFLDNRHEIVGAVIIDKVNMINTTNKVMLDPLRQDM
jgi:hypothetical protein